MGEQQPSATLTRRREAKPVGKSSAAFRTISEVAEELDVAQHVLRFWESKFSQVRPLKRAGGRRYYRPEDVAVLQQIRDLLYTQRYTIKGAQQYLREQRKGGDRTEERPSTAEAAPANGLPDAARERLKRVRAELLAVKAALEG